MFDLHTWAHHTNSSCLVSTLRVSASREKQKTTQQSSCFRVRLYLSTSASFVVTWWQFDLDLDLAAPQVKTSDVSWRTHLLWLNGNFHFITCMFICRAQTEAAANRNTGTCFQPSPPHPALLQRNMPANDQGSCLPPTMFHCRALALQFLCDCGSEGTWWFQSGRRQWGHSWTTGISRKLWICHPLVLQRFFKFALV